MRKMKKFLVLLFMVITVECFTSGCNEKEEPKFIFGTDLCRYDMYVESGDNIGINIPFAYNVSKDNIKLISVEGENIKASEINFFDDTVEPCNKAEVDGYKLGYFGFIVENCEKSFKVNSLHIEIAGQEQTLIFNTPLVIRVNDNGREMYEGTTADYIGGGGKNRLQYSFLIEEDITVTGYNFTGGYIIEEADVWDGDKKLAQTPYEIHKDGELIFSLGTNSSDEDMYKFLGFNFAVEYINEKGFEEVFYVDVRQQAAGDEKSCLEVLKLIVQN